MHKNGEEGSSQAFSHSLEPNPSRNHGDLEQGSWEALSLREGELLFEVNESGKKMTIVGERVRYKYHHHHPQNGRVRQTLEPPCQGAEVPRLSTEFHAGQSR